MKAQRWKLAAILGATFMLLVDVTIIQVALPTIQREMHASFTSLAWVIDAYALTLAAFILTSGTLADRFGRRRIFVWGVGVFTAASRSAASRRPPLQLDLAPRPPGRRRRGDVRDLARADRPGVRRPRAR